MALLQFDGAGRVQLTRLWTASGDFTITFPSIDFVEPGAGNQEPLIGERNSNVHFIGFLSSGRIAVRVNTSSGGEEIIDSGYSDGDPVQITVIRSGGTLDLQVNASSVGTVASSSTFELNSIGAYNFENFVFTGQMDGVLTFTGGSEDMSFDFNQTPGSTTLPDSISSNDGTLTGFVTGGFIEPAGGAITIDSFTDTIGKAKQRDGNGQAVFLVEGDAINNPSAVEYQLDGTGPWLVLDNAPAGGRYSGNVTITGQQDITVRDADTPAETATVSKVTAGAVIMAWGQSNFAGRGINNQPYAAIGNNPVAQMWKSGNNILDVADPTGSDGQEAGSVFPRIAQLYSDLGVPIIIANVARGGSLIASWDKNSGTHYPNLTEVFNDLGGVELAVSCIGESDTLASTPQATYESEYNTVINDINTDFGCDNYVTYFPVGDTLNAMPTELAAIRTGITNIIASNANARNGGDLSVIDIDIATTPGNDGLHLKQDADLTQGGDIVYTALNSSTFSITTSGAPDGTFRASLIDGTLNAVYTGNITVTSNTITVQVSSPIGTLLRGVTFDNSDPSSSGMWLQGTTS